MKDKDRLWEAFDDYYDGEASHFQCFKAGTSYADKEAYKMSAELEYYRRFHNYVRDHDMNEMDYKRVCEFLFSKDDR